MFPSSLKIITSEPAIKDDCPVLTRMKAYVVPLGVVPILQHVFRDPKGEPVDLTDYFDAYNPSSSTSESEAPSTGSYTLMLRAKEIIAPAGPRNPVLAVDGYCVDPANGVVQFQLTSDMVQQAGIYQLSVGIANSDLELQYVENPIMWVERTLFAMSELDHTYNNGPPTLESIRELIMDSGAGDNLLLDDVEFTNDQIAYAASIPISNWNEQPPPIRPLMNTRNFPFRDAWSRAIAGNLFMTAAHNYRRNHLPYNAGGVAIDDKNKEKEYAAMGQLLLGEWKEFVRLKKYEINVAAFTGTVGSIYGGLFH